MDPKHRRRIDAVARLGTWHLVPSTEYQVQGARYIVRGIWYQAPGTWYLVSSTRYRVPGARYLAPGIRYQVPRTRCLVPSTRCQVPDARYQVPGTKYMVSIAIYLRRLLLLAAAAAWCLVLGTPWTPSRGQTHHNPMAQTLKCHCWAGPAGVLSFGWRIVIMD